MKKVRVSTIREAKKAGQKVVALTAHDALTAAIAEAAEVDLLLVGDSLGMTALGFETTLRVTLDMMIHHAAAVSRAASLPLIIGDMPFMTYKLNAEQALANAGRFVQEGGVEGVKIEGGAEVAPMIRRLVDAGIPALGHIGLLPQSVHAMGGYKIQGRDEEDALRLIADARALEEAGAFAVVLEGIPAAVAARVTAAVSIPTIGIGAGAGCDGQILVISDVLGMTNKKIPKFTKKYADLFTTSLDATKQYAADVRNGTFPAAEHEYE